MDIHTRRVTNSTGSKCTPTKTAHLNDLYMPTTEQPFAHTVTHTSGVSLTCVHMYMHTNPGFLLLVRTGHLYTHTHTHTNLSVSLMQFLVNVSFEISLAVGEDVPATCVTSLCKRCCISGFLATSWSKKAAVFAVWVGGRAKQWDVHSVRYAMCVYTRASTHIQLNNRCFQN